MTQDLRDDLTAMAGEVDDVDLRDRVLTGSRRLARRRLIAAGAAALLAAAALGAASIHDERNAMPTQVPLPTGTVDRIDGTFYEGFLPDGQLDAATDKRKPTGKHHSGKVYRWTPGAKAMTRVDQDAGGLYYYSAALSPDGKRIAYLTADDRGDRIRVAPVDGGEAHTVGSFSGWRDICSAPTWASDGQRLFVDRGAGHGDRRFGFINVDSGKFRASAQPPGCDVKVARSHGEDVLYSLVAHKRSTEVYRTYPSGRSVRTGAARTLDRTEVPIDGLYIGSLGAVSPDGRFLCVGTTDVAKASGFGADPHSCDRIVDLANRDVLHTPEHNDDPDYLEEATAGPSVFAIPGRLLVYADRDAKTYAQLFDYHGQLIDERPTTGTPGGKGDTTNFGYTPKP